MTFTRRELLATGGALGAVLAAGVVVPVGFVLSEDDADSSGATGALLAEFPRTQVASLSELRVGEPVFFEYPLEGQTNVLVALGSAAIGGVGTDGDVVAYSNSCTHMGCPITEFQPDHSVLGPCPCHFTSFDLGRDGQVTLGQATQNLPRVLLEVDGDDVFATGVYRLVYGHHNTLGGVTAQAAT
ncbi:MAG: arsenate reductase (azurin) small subunit [Acidimicrobiales bacterium]